MSRWSNWSRGESEKPRFLSGFVKEALDTGNPAVASSPAERARQLGLQSDGSGGYIDPETGQKVAATVNGELVFYDNRGQSGGAVSDGSGGADLVNAQPTWSDPLTGLAITPPSHPESPFEKGAVPDSIPASAPAGYDSFMNQTKMRMYDQQQQVNATHNVNNPMQAAPAAGINPIGAGGTVDQGPNMEMPGMAEGVGDNAEMRGKMGMLPKLGKTFAQMRGQLRGNPEPLENPMSIPEEIPQDMSEEDSDPNQLEIGKGMSGFEEVIDRVQDFFQNMEGLGSKLNSYGDELGDPLTQAAESRDGKDVLKTLLDYKMRDMGQLNEEIEYPEGVYVPQSPGGLGSDRGFQVEDALTRFVLPKLFGHDQFTNDGGNAIKTDVRDLRDNHGYTVKSSGGSVEGDNAGFKRFFEKWGFDPDTPEAKGLMKYFGFPVNYAQDQGFGDDLGRWDDARDGRRETLARQLPIQRMFPNIEDWRDEELGSNAFHPERIREQFPEEYEGMMRWLNDNKMEIVRRSMRQRDHDQDSEPREYDTFDPEPVDRSAFFHIDEAQMTPYLKGNMSIHDISDDEVRKVLENPETNWNLSNSMNGGFRLNTPNPNYTGRRGGRGSQIPLMNFTRKATLAGGRYGNTYHSPRMGFSAKSFDAFPEIAEVPLEMTMGANQYSPVLKANGQPAMRGGQPRMQRQAGKVLQESVKVGEPRWGEGYNPSDL